MTIDEKREKCCEFFKKLTDALSDTHVILKSCNSNPQDISKYLIPIGTENQVSYFGKPVGSFRISDHWNWYANVNKNPNEKYVQCLSVDMPWAKKRKAPGKPSYPVTGIQVALVDTDKKYHAVYGEKYDKKTKKWDWLETDVNTVVDMVKALP